VGEHVLLDAQQAIAQFPQRSTRLRNIATGILIYEHESERQMKDSYGMYEDVSRNQD